MSKATDFPFGANPARRCVGCDVPIVRDEPAFSACLILSTVHNSPQLQACSVSLPICRGCAEKQSHKQLSWALLQGFLGARKRLREKIARKK